MIRSLVVACALLILVGCADGGTEGQGSTSAMCSEDIPFTTTFLPQGFDADAVPGPGGGASLPADQVVVHYQGAEGVFIDVFRGSSRYQVSGGLPVTVLGRQGEIGTIEDGYGVDFTQGTPVVCNRHHVEAFGVSEEDVRRFAERLRAD